MGGDWNCLLILLALMRANGVWTDDMQHVGSAEEGMHNGCFDL
jgi:hypothetical protein